MIEITQGAGIPAEMVAGVFTSADGSMAGVRAARSGFFLDRIEFMLIVSMRRAQREYFATRSKEVLERSKKVEREVDCLIDIATNIQPDLFRGLV